MTHGCPDLGVRRKTWLAFLLAVLGVIASARPATAQALSGGLARRSSSASQVTMPWRADAPVEAATSLQTSSRGGHGLRWALIGFAAGAAAGVTFATVHCSHITETNDCRRAWSAFLVPVLGGGGAIAGGILGDVAPDRTIRVPVWSGSPVSVTARVGTRARTLTFNVDF